MKNDKRESWNLLKQHIISTLLRDEEERIDMIVDRERSDQITKVDDAMIALRKDLVGKAVFRIEQRIHEAIKNHDFDVLMQDVNKASRRLKRRLEMLEKSRIGRLLALDGTEETKKRVSERLSYLIKRYDAVPVLDSYDL